MLKFKLVMLTIIGATGYIAWAIMAFYDPSQRTAFLSFNMTLATGTIGLVLRDMPSSNQPEITKEIQP